MNGAVRHSVILQTATRYMQPLLLLYSLFLLFRGHNEPGGGFVGGLTAAAAFVLFAIAHDVPSARRALRAEPHALIGTGLLVAAASASLSLFTGRAFMQGMWTTLHFGDLGEIHIGTPSVFDMGVYMVVLGVTTLLIFSLAEE